MDIYEELSQITEAHRKLEALLDERPNLKQHIQFQDVIKAVNSRSVFKITWKGEPAIAKMAHDENRVRITWKQADALTKMAEILSPPAYVPKLLHNAPKAGLFIQSFIDAPTAEWHMEIGNADIVFETIRAACLWQSVASRTRTQKKFDHSLLSDNLNPNKIAGDPAKRHRLPPPESLELGHQVAEKTRMLMAQTTCPATFARGHGDFLPHNFIPEKDRVTAIDLGGQTSFPLCADLARFAVAAIRFYGAKGPIFGLREDMHAQIAALLPDQEAKEVFPIYYGAELANRLYRKRRQHSQTRAQARVFLAHSF